MSLQELAHAQGLSIEEVLDRLLLSLLDALFLTQSIQWTENNVANLGSDEANELARWFLRGQAVGTKPIFPPSPTSSTRNLLFLNTQ